MKHQCGAASPELSQGWNRSAEVEPNCISSLVIPVCTLELGHGERKHSRSIYVFPASCPLTQPHSCQIQQFKGRRVMRFYFLSPKLLSGCVSDPFAIDISIAHEVTPGDGADGAAPGGPGTFPCAAGNECGSGNDASCLMKKNPFLKSYYTLWRNETQDISLFIFNNKL